MKALLFLSLFVGILTSCAFGNLQKKNEFSLVQSSNPSINYKKNTYHLFIGQLIDSIEKVVELRHSYLADDGVIDTNGVTHYMNIGEDLIKIGDSDYLPALFFTTNKRILTLFECSIMFSPNKYKSNKILNSLSDISSLFPILNSVENRKILAKTLKLNIKTNGFEERFYLEIRNSYDMTFYYEKGKIKD